MCTGMRAMEYIVFKKESCVSVGPHVLFKEEYLGVHCCKCQGSELAVSSTVRFFKAGVVIALTWMLATRIKFSYAVLYSPDC